MFLEIQAAFANSLTPAVTPASRQRRDVWVQLAEQVSSYSEEFARKSFEISGLEARHNKTKVLPIGFDCTTATVVTEEEIVSHCKNLKFLCDRCGVWRGPTQRSLKSHQALHCTLGKSVRLWGEGAKSSTWHCLPGIPHRPAGVLRTWLFQVGTRDQGLRRRDLHLLRPVLQTIRGS